jgi:hypothetical protein
METIPADAMEDLYQRAVALVRNRIDPSISSLMCQLGTASYDAVVKMIDRMENEGLVSTFYLGNRRVWIWKEGLGMDDQRDRLISLLDGIGCREYNICNWEGRGKARMMADALRAETHGNSIIMSHPSDSQISQMS